MLSGGEIAGICVAVVIVLACIIPLICIYCCACCACCIAVAEEAQKKKDMEKGISGSASTVDVNGKGNVIANSAKEDGGCSTPDVLINGHPVIMANPKGKVEISTVNKKGKEITTIMIDGKVVSRTVENEENRSKTGTVDEMSKE